MGATAVGKTAYCVKKAKAWQTEVISADSRQFYQEMQIGTARPLPEEMQDVPHHFIASHSIHEPLAVGQYEKEALQRLGVLFRKYDRLILTGGSGLYLRAITQGLDEVPPSDPALRQKLEEQLETEGLSSLVRQLRQHDPEYAGTADLQNPRRVVRALEVCLLSGKTYSSFRQQQPAIERPFRVEKYVLDRPREELYERINLRVEQMMDAGLLEEARRLYPYRHLKPLQTVGYQELFDVFEGKITLEEAVRLIQRNTRRYAKRQLTWFRREPDARWIQL